MQQLVSKARHSAFALWERLFSSKLEDLHRGRGSWARQLRRATLLGLGTFWGASRADIEAQNDSIQTRLRDISRQQRLRLCENRSFFYKRYNLMRPAAAAAPLPRLASSTGEDKAAWGANLLPLAQGSAPPLSTFASSSSTLVKLYSPKEDLSLDPEYVAPTVLQALRWSSSSVAAAGGAGGDDEPSKVPPH